MSSSYLVHRAAGAADSLLDPGHAAWPLAGCVSWGAAPYVTWFRALWSDGALHLRFDVGDVSPWHTMTARDDRLWEEEVVEIFLDPGRAGSNYAELEISPANVVCDLIVRRPWPQLESDPSWHIEGLETRVTPWPAPPAGSDGWIATARVPWAGLRSLPARVTMPPEPGDAWGFNVFRIKRPGGPAHADGTPLLFAWSPTGAPSFHVPSAFGDLVFADS